MAHDHHAPETKSSASIYIILGFILTAIGAFAVGYFVARSPGLADLPDTTAEASAASFDSPVLPIKGSPVKGSNTAPVTVVEFSDFQCPGCRTASEHILPDLVKDFGAENVRIVFKHFPLNIHQDAQMAAQASYAAGQQGKFWEFHDLVFKNFPGDDGDKDFLKEDKLVGYATELSLDIDRFKRDMKADATRRQVLADIELGKRLGVGGTPSFFVNGRKVNFSSGITYEAVSQVVSEELTKFDKMKEIPNAYYAYSVYANSELADGLGERPASPNLGRGGVAGGAAGGAAAVEGAAFAGAKGSVKGDAPAPAGQLGLDGLPFKGSPNAKVTILEYSDFECPFCGKVNPALAQLLKAYPNDVRVIFVQHPLGFHKNAHLAAQASLAAHEQGKFWEYHDILFANKKALQRPDLEKYAQQLQLDMGKFKSALDSGKFKKEVDRQMATARAYGITGTPGFAINGVKFSGAQPFEKFKTVVDSELARANKVAKSTGKSGDALYYELVKSAPKAPEPARPAQPKQPEGRQFIAAGSSPVYGDPNAPVVLFEFSDFECPYCSRGGKTVKELVDANKGKVKVVFKHNPLAFHKNARLAHKASIAAHKQGKFWEYHDILFANQKALQRPQLIAYAKQLQLDIPKFEKDMDDPAADKVVEGDMKAGEAVGVRGTPHFFMNGTRISGAQPLASFQGTLDDELKVVEKYKKKGIANDKIYETIVKEEKPPTPEVDLKGAPFKGAANGKVVLVAYSDFQCPFCSKVNPTIDALLEKYPKDLKVVFKQLPLDFHKDAPLAAAASLAAHEQGKFWEYHDILFANQKAIKRPDLEKYAQQLQLDMTKFKAALDSGKFKKQVEKDTAEARSFGITGTPSFLINGEKFVGAQPVDAFSAKIDAALGK